MSALTDRLEDRKLLAAAITARLINGELIVNGTEASDNITVLQDGNRLSVSGVRIQRGSSLVSSVSPAEVKKIRISGNGGNDRIDLDGRSDKTGRVTIPTVIDGGSGNDTIYGGDGRDLIFGGSGRDNLYGRGGNDELQGGTGNDRLFGDADRDNLFGGGDHDFLDGGSSNDYLDGGSGNDTLDGGSGNDDLWGGTGDDELRGGSGSDYLNGEGGNDRLLGGTGRATHSDTRQKLRPVTSIPADKSVGEHIRWSARERGSGSLGGTDWDTGYRRERYLSDRVYSATVRVFAQTSTLTVAIPIHVLP